MKRLFLIMLLLPVQLLSQVTFCESVDQAGNPKNAANEFTIGNDGGFFKIHVKLNRRVDCRSVIFDVYRIENGKEIFDNSLGMEVYPVLSWFYKEITFYKAGVYRVYVYDEKDKLLGVGEVKIKVR